MQALTGPVCLLISGCVATLVAGWPAFATCVFAVGVWESIAEVRHMRRVRRNPPRPPEHW